MKSILLAFLWLTAMGLSAQESDEATTFVPSSLPIYVNGQRLEPRNGGHTLSRSREKGISVDDMVYLSVTKTKPFVVPSKGDGMQYAVHGAMSAASSALAAGKNRNEAKQAMVAFWTREFGGELTITTEPADEYVFILRYRGQQYIVPVPCVADYHPERQPIDNYDTAVVPRYRELVSLLQNGSMVICGQSYVHEIAASDAAQALDELKNLARQKRTLTMVGGQTIVAGVQLVGGKYELTNLAVNDLMSHQ